MKTANYTMILEFKKGQPDFPTSIRQLAIELMKYQRKEKLNELLKKYKTDEKIS